LISLLIALTLAQPIDPLRPKFRSARIDVLDAGVANIVAQETVGGPLFITNTPATAQLVARDPSSTTTWALWVDRVNSTTRRAICLAGDLSTSSCLNYISVDGTSVATFSAGVSAAGYGDTLSPGTAGSGTGITANTTSAVVDHSHKITVTNAALTAAATTDVTIWTTPVNTRLKRIVAEVTQVFTGGALSAMTVQCGNAAGGTQYLLAGSVLAATTTLGDVQAEIGAGLLSATVADMGTPASGIPGAIAISCRFSCTGANCSAATQGSVSFYIDLATYR
jgi:hypothetical protein